MDCCGIPLLRNRVSAETVEQRDSGDVVNVMGEYESAMQVNYYSGRKRRNSGSVSIKKSASSAIAWGKLRI